jgi:hypothetical protein
MSGKHVPVNLKPGSQKRAEDWVTQPITSAPAPSPDSVPIPTKRLTIDVSEDLHRRLKIKAASDGVKMADLVRRWIEDGCAE